MNVVKVSPKFQIVIPQAIRESMKIKPGERIEVVQYDNRIELIPVRQLSSMRGFLKGMDTSIVREDDCIAGKK